MKTWFFTRERHIMCLSEEIVCYFDQGFLVSSHAFRSKSNLRTHPTLKQQKKNITKILQTYGYQPRFDQFQYVNFSEFRAKLLCSELWDLAPLFWSNLFGLAFCIHNCHIKDEIRNLDASLDDTSIRKLTFQQKHHIKIIPSIRKVM